MPMSPGSPGTRKPDSGSPPRAQTVPGSSGLRETVVGSSRRNGRPPWTVACLTTPDNTDSRTDGEATFADVRERASAANTVAAPTKPANGGRLSNKRRPDPDGPFVPVPLAERLALRVQGARERAEREGRLARGSR